MQIKPLLPILAASGFALGIFTVIQGNKPTPVAPAVTQPAEAPFRAYIAGAGIVEAKTRNIAIGSALPGLVKTLDVKVGDHVRAGDLLFTIDDRDALALLEMRQADLQRAKAGLAEANATLNEARTLLRLAESVTDRRAISVEDLEQRRNNVQISQARVLTASAQIRQAESQIGSTLTLLERLKVRAPMEGEILQANLRPGEFAQSGNGSGTQGNPPLLVMGNLDQLHVRVDIDENDVWRFQPSGRAVAYLRGNRDLSTPLNLAYVEPYVIPKRSLTGDSTERVDTRVLQALYEYDPKQLQAYVGQQMDVFIEVQPPPARSDTAAAAARP